MSLRRVQGQIQNLAESTYGLLTKCEVKMAFCVFMDRDGSPAP